MININDVWRTSADTFNNWRRENDLPLLIKFFKETLPHFNEWQETFSITDEIILKSNQTSEFFVGEGKFTFFSYNNPWYKGATVEASPTSSFLRSKKWADDNNEKIKEGREKFHYEVFSEFEPYFDWLHKVKKIKSFDVQSKYKTGGSFEDFTYNNWSGPPDRSISAEIFGKHEALNIGGVRIGAHALRGRNLDFTNLDGIQIVGKRIGGTNFSYIRYSSCRNLELIDLDMAFLEFERCYFSEVSIVNCEIQDLHLRKIRGYCGIKRIVESRLTKLIFDDCCPIGSGTDLNRADMPEYEFKNTSVIRAQEKYHFFNKMRKAAQDFGYSHQAQKDFYMERKYSMIVRFDPNSIREYRILNHPKNIRNLGRHIWRNGFRIDRSIGLLRRKLLEEIRVFSKFQFLFSYIAIRVNGISEVANFLVWGFGEKPKRVLCVAGIDILVFACFYYFLRFKNDFLESLVTSIFVFTSIGYGEMHPDLFLKYVIGIQSISGLILVGLFLSSLVNKVRY